MGIISKEGIFKTGYPDENKYGKILSFDDKGYRMELIENYETSHDDRIQYYFFTRIISSIPGGAMIPFFMNGI